MWVFSSTYVFSYTNNNAVVMDCVLLEIFWFLFRERQSQVLKKKIGKNLNGVLKYSLNPFTPTSDQDRISPYNINTISSRQVMRIEKNVNHGIIS